FLLHAHQVQLAIEGVALSRNDFKVGRFTAFKQQVGIFDAKLGSSYPLLGDGKLLVELFDHHKRVGYLMHGVRYGMLETDLSLVAFQLGDFVLCFESPTIEYRLRNTADQPAKQRPGYIEPILR